MMHENYLLRKASSSDSSQLAQMRWDFKHEEGVRAGCVRDEFIENCSLWIKESLNSKFWYCWIACNGEEIVAHVFVCKIPKVPSPDNQIDAIAYITNVYTKPNYRNKEIGLKLMRQVQNWGAEQKIELLFVWPSDKSITFYKRAGYTEPELFLEFKL